MFHSQASSLVCCGMMGGEVDQYYWPCGVQWVSGRPWMVGATEREPSRTFSNGNELSRNASNVSTIRQNIQHGLWGTQDGSAVFSSSVFIMKMCLLSWLDAHVMRIPTNRENAAASQAAVHNIEEKIEMIGLEQGGWKEEGMDNRAVWLLNRQFEEMLFEAAKHSESPWIFSLRMSRALDLHIYFAPLFGLITCTSRGRMLFCNRHDEITEES